MPTNLSIAAIRSTTLAGWTIVAMFAASCAVGIWLLVSVMINAPEARAAIARQNAQEIALEDRAFCAKFGMGPDTLAFRACAEEVARIRRQQEERWMRISTYSL